MSKGKGKKVAYIGEFSPVETLFNELHDNNTAMKRIPPFVETKIIETSMYKKMMTQMSMCMLVPGNSLHVSRMLAEATLSTYKFQTYAQYKSWTSQLIKIKQKHGQSYEAYHTNVENTLNYKAMINEIQNRIQLGEGKYITREKTKDHPYFKEHIENKMYLEKSLRDINKNIRLNH